MSDFNLLLTCVGGELAPLVIRLLKASKRHNVRVIGVDESPDAAGRHFADVFVRVPGGTDPDYVPTIAGIVATEGVDLVLPTSDEEALALAAARGQVENHGCRLACAEADVLRTITNKADTYDMLKTLGLSVPDWTRAASLERIADGVGEIIGRHGAAVVKPAEARGGRNVCVIRGDLSGAHPYAGGREVHMDLATFHRDFLPSYGAHLPAIVMQRLAEPVFDIDMLAQDGRAVRIIPRRRVDSAMPNEGHTFVGNDDLIALGRRLIEGLSLSWLYDCDVMYDDEGQANVLEVNPRPSGSVAASITAGVPLLDDVISLAKGEPVPHVDMPVGRVVVPYKSLAAVEL